MQKNQTTILDNKLSEQLEEYKEILTNEIIEYLDSLINLEISALKEDIISKSQMDQLKELKLYRQIAIHNVYNRILNVFQKYESVFHLEQYPYIMNIVAKDIFKKQHELLNYCIHENGVSTICIKQTIIDPLKRQEQLDKLYEELVELKSSKGLSKELKNKLIFIDKATRIKYIINAIKELENRSKIEVDIKPIISLENEFINQILGSEGLDVTQDFIEKKYSSGIYVANKSVNLNPYCNEIEKSLIKRLVKDYPHTQISKIIKYY